MSKLNNVLDNVGKKVAIYQIENSECVDYAFRPYNEKLFNPRDYKKVWQHDHITAYSVANPHEDILEGLFNVFNVYETQPADFRGHSLSMSDVVVIDNKAYYCDMVGWVSLGEVDFFDNSED